MKTEIRPDLNKPFRGITTIQLFDKDTGELVEEHRDENTYNDRLQYINYLDTIVRCASPNRKNNLTDFLQFSRDTSDSSFFKNLKYYRIPNTYDNSFSVRQLFGTLLLTNNTKAETAHGYLNGQPVGVACTTGNNAAYISKSCSGMFNAEESYYGNDRLHLVFDFATDKCNTQFDAMWLLPSSVRYREDVSADYAVPSLHQHMAISKVSVDTEIIKYQHTIFSMYINAPYYITAQTNYKNGSYVDAIQILNANSGESVSQIVFSSMKQMYTPFYYDSANNCLYTICAYSSGYITRIFTEDSVWAMYKVDLDSGNVTMVGYLCDLLSLSKSDYPNIDSSSVSGNLQILFRNDGRVSLLLKLFYTDDDKKGYYTLYDFDAASTSFSKIANLPIYTVVETGKSISLIDDEIYSVNALSAECPKDYTYSTFNVKTGDITCINTISISKDFITSNWGTQLISYDSSSYVFAVNDESRYRKPMCYVDDSKNTLYKCSNFTAPWSTHNKLTSAVSKTSATTMKIQYDIIWDSITDVIVPALM